MKVEFCLSGHNGGGGGEAGSREQNNNKRKKKKKNTFFFFSWGIQTTCHTFSYSDLIFFVVVVLKMTLFCTRLL